MVLLNYIKLTHFQTTVSPLTTHRINDVPQYMIRTSISTELKMRWTHSSTMVGYCDYIIPLNLCNLSSHWNSNCFHWSLHTKDKYYRRETTTSTSAQSSNRRRRRKWKMTTTAAAAAAMKSGKNQTTTTETSTASPHHHQPSWINYPSGRRRRGVMPAVGMVLIIVVGKGWVGCLARETLLTMGFLQPQQTARYSNRWTDCCCRRAIHPLKWRWGMKKHRHIQFWSDQVALL